MSNANPGDPTPTLTDRHFLHRVAVECVQAVTDVSRMVFPTPKNLCGDLGANEAKSRLDRLAAVVAWFPKGTPCPDPFAQPGGPVTIENQYLTPISGSSYHDVSAQLACRVYAKLRIQNLVGVKDSKTGKWTLSPEWEGGFTKMVEERRPSGKIVRSSVSCIPFRDPVTLHYTLFPWSGDVWQRLRRVIQREADWPTFADVLPTVEGKLRWEFSLIMREFPAVADQDSPPMIGPLSIKTWMNIFARSSRTTVSKYLKTLGAVRALEGGDTGWSVLLSKLSPDQQAKAATAYAKVAQERSQL